jgi:hypothetical protein
MYTDIVTDKDFWVKKGKGALVFRPGKYIKDSRAAYVLAKPKV